jgi:hypothetical protein
VIDTNDLIAQLVQLRIHIRELEPLATEDYARRTIERAKRRARAIVTRLRRAGVAVEAA